MYTHIQIYIGPRLQAGLRRIADLPRGRPGPPAGARTYIYIYICIYNIYIYIYIYIFGRLTAG